MRVIVMPENEDEIYYASRLAEVLLLMGHVLSTAKVAKDRITWSAVTDNAPNVLPMIGPLCEAGDTLTIRLTEDGRVGITSRNGQQRAQDAQRNPSRALIFDEIDDIPGL